MHIPVIFPCITTFTFSEDVSIFNAYEEYTFSENVKEIVIHGNITYLGCASNMLTGLDVTANPYLTTLNCPHNKLSGIDISKKQIIATL